MNFIYKYYHFPLNNKYNTTKFFNLFEKYIIYYIRCNEDVFIIEKIIFQLNLHFKSLFIYTYSLDYDRSVLLINPILPVLKITRLI